MFSCLAVVGVWPHFLSNNQEHSVIMGLLKIDLAVCVYKSFLCKGVLQVSVLKWPYTKVSSVYHYYFWLILLLAGLKQKMIIVFV